MYHNFPKVLELSGSSLLNNRRLQTPEKNWLNRGFNPIRIECPWAAWCFAFATPWRGANRRARGKADAPAPLGLRMDSLGASGQPVCQQFKGWTASVPAGSLCASRPASSLCASRVDSLGASGGLTGYSSALNCSLIILTFLFFSELKSIF